MSLGLPNFQNAPIRRKLVLLMLLTSIVGMAIAAPAWIAFAWQSARASAVRDLETTSRVIAENSTAAMTFGDTKAATEILSALRAKPEVIDACLYRLDHDSARRFASYASAHQQCPLQPDQNPQTDGWEKIGVVVPVVLGNEQIGSLRVTQSLQGLRDALLRQVRFTLATLAASFALSFFIAVRAQGAITRPILRLTEAARRVSETKDYALRVPEQGRDELSQLSTDFNHMLGQIEKADQEVQRGRKALASEVEKKAAANQELEHALERLQATQTQLVQSEKMASLGALVAGIAHEINTPVGIGVTAASTLQARASQIKLKYEKDNLTRSELERFLETANDAGDIILNNLQRAADLIQSFKRVAVDQSSNERRVFPLKRYLGEVLQSLAPKLKHGGHSVTVDCPDDLQMDSYPGVLAQILTNFVSNSLLHAFGTEPNGHITIAAHLDGDEVVLRCADDGKGIAPDNLARIFDPFFTTKRGSGGTGLGLHIVYNLVTKTLGGSIRAESVPGQGMAILTRIPRVAVATEVSK